MDDEDVIGDSVFAPLREEADAAELKLRAAVAAYCLAPHHNPTQHRDGKPPWCEACGRTARGVRQAW